MKRGYWRNGAWRIFAAIWLAAAAVVPAEATTLMHMSLAQMAQTAKAIVRARCIDNATIEQSGEIWTVTTFEVEEAWRGANLPQRIAVRLLGGTAGNITSRVSGIPHFQPGEETVLFLEATSRGDFSIVSWQQGTFRISHNRGTSGDVVTQDTASFATFYPGSRRFEETGISGMPIASFHEQVEAALRDGASRNQ